MSELIDRQAMINEINLHVGILYDSPTLVESLKLLVRSLPSAEPENADCIYCHEDSDGYVKPIEKNCHAFIRFGMNGWEISLSVKGWNGSAKIMYCPMCGRRLKK